MEAMDTTNTTNTTKKKKRKNKRKQKILISFIIILLLVCVGIGIYMVLSKENPNIVQTKEADYHTISYEGEDYKYNTSIVSILVLGTDSSKEDEQGQADTIQLMLLNRETESIQVIALSRDIMTEIRMFDVARNDLGWNREHLALAYAYGDTKATGCILTNQAVSKLLYNVPINFYGAMNINALSEVHNVVGELTVTVPNDSLESVNESWTKGATVTLTKDNVEQFLRPRNTSEKFSNNDRMQRHEAYLTAYFDKIREMLQNDFDKTLEKLYYASRSMTTNITLKDIQVFAQMALTYKFNPETDYYILEGDNVSGEFHDEFEVDQEYLKSLVVQLFYDKEEER